MSKYTTEVRFICEQKSGFSLEELETKTPDQIIDASRVFIFNFSYPIYDSSHKPELEKKILKNYYTREIGAETVALWQLWLNNKLNMIMPKYNRLYALEAASLESMLNNIDVKETTNREDDFTREHDTTRTDNLADGTTADSTIRNRYSDTPQGTIANVDNDSYLTDYRNITSHDSGGVTHTGTQETAGSETNSGTQDILRTEIGYRGGKTRAELLYDYAERVLNIDMMIVNELADLFLLLW